MVSDRPWLAVRGGVPGNTRAAVTPLPGTERRVVLVRVDPTERRGALGTRDSETLAEGARRALAERLPLVVVLASAGADVQDVVAALHGWG
ncbi:MAG: hypothetical protein ACRDZY_15585, partial [Acidimicrobiales bacterium]